MSHVYCDPIDEIVEDAKAIINAQNQGLLGLGQADALSTIASAITSAAQIATDYYLKKEALETQEDLAKLQAQVAAQRVAQQAPSPATASAVPGLASWAVPVGLAIAGTYIAYQIFGKRRRR